MYSFKNDYSEGAHERILKILSSTSLEQNIAYGEDIHSNKAKEYIKQLIQRKDLDIHFMVGGTQTNLVAISSFLRPHQCVISAETGHINVHETGAIEATGHKVVVAPGKEGKLTPEAIQAVLDKHGDEHMVQPKMVYISNSTELGTIYTKAELVALSKICRRNNLLLYLDGARLASALTAQTNDLEMKDIGELVDAFYIGATKNGALLGEALVICNDNLKEDFRYLLKQKGAMLAKGFVVGIQFEALFQDNLYFELGAHANRMANQLAVVIKDYGYKFYAEQCTNQIFVIFPNDIVDKLSRKFSFEIQDKLDEENTLIRLVTSWATSQESVDAFCNYLKNIKDIY
ncbi:MAG: low specificity L-threonine aldolase [Clostridiales bacterium]|nr:low specificity L-threonine aldolase [Clostridiales bacterium]